MYKKYKKPFIKLISHLGKKIHDEKFDKPPIYIGGCPRSGTTLLLSIISSHPDVFACPVELDMFCEVGKDDKGKVYPKRLDRLYRTLIINKIKETSNRWCEKTPDNVTAIKEIDEYHNGNFKFLNIVRDGRDVVLSKHPKSSKKFWVNPEKWIHNVNCGYEHKDNPKVHTLRYEDLILDFHNEVEKICDFLNISKQDEIMNWHDHTKVRKNSAYHGEVKDIFKTSIGKWKKDENKKRVKELLNMKNAIELLSFYQYEI